jgi:DNA-binding response OmpR family regulator
VALSGWSQEDVRKRALEAGFDHFFVKPIDIDALVDLVGSSPAQNTAGEADRTG